MCGKELKNPNSTSYVNSKFLQDKLQQSSLGKKHIVKIDTSIKKDEFKLF